MPWPSNVTFNFTQRGQSWPKIGPKMLFSLFSLNYFLYFCQNIFQNSTDFHNGSWLEVSSKKDFFYCKAGLLGDPKTVQINPKLQFHQDLHQFVGTFSINYP